MRLCFLSICIKNWGVYFSSDTDIETIQFLHILVGICVFLLQLRTVLPIQFDGELRLFWMHCFFIKSNDTCTGQPCCCSLELVCHSICQRAQSPVGAADSPRCCKLWLPVSCLILRPKILFNFSAAKSRNKIEIQSFSFADGLPGDLCTPAEPTQRQEKKSDNASCSAAVGKWNIILNLFQICLPFSPPFCFWSRAEAKETWLRP